MYEMGANSLVKRYLVIGVLLIITIVIVHSLWKSAPTPERELVHKENDQGSDDKLKSQNAALQDIFKAGSTNEPNITQKSKVEGAEVTTPVDITLSTSEEEVDGKIGSKFNILVPYDKDKPKDYGSRDGKMEMKDYLVKLRKEAVSVTDSAENVSKQHQASNSTTESPATTKSNPTNISHNSKTKNITDNSKTKISPKSETLKTETSKGTSPKDIFLNKNSDKNSQNNKTAEPNQSASKSQLPRKASTDKSPELSPNDLKEKKITLDAKVNGWNTINPSFQSLDVTASFATDPSFKKVGNITIDELVGFFRNITNRCNSDGSCYENWLSDKMTFPPTSHWDVEYQTPCYTDHMTAKFRCVPHIYMVGWAKSGTTDMWYYFQQNPGLVPGWKETQFLTQFSFQEDHKHMKTFDELLSGFFDVRSRVKQQPHPEKLMLDATATMIYDNWHWRIKQGYQGDEHVPTHTNFHYLRKIHPGAQIVVMMRNPTTRALSFYNHGVDMTLNNNANLRFKYKHRTNSPVDIHQFFVESIYYFNECVKKTSLRACCHMSGWESQDWGDPKYFMTLRIGIYYVFLEEVYKNYPPAQVHLVKAEDFYNSPVPTLNSVFQFMGVTTDKTAEMVKRKGNYRAMTIKKYFTPLPGTYKLLQAFYAPFNERLQDMLGEDKWSTWEKEIDNIIKPSNTPGI